MPAMKQFTVTQVRQVSVRANEIVGAIRIADAAFRNGQNTDNGVIDGPDDIWGNTRNKIEVTDIHATEEK